MTMVIIIFLFAVLVGFVNWVFFESGDNENRK